MRKVSSAPNLSELSVKAPPTAKALAGGGLCSRAPAMGRPWGSTSNLPGHAGLFKAANVGDRSSNGVACHAFLLPDAVTAMAAAAEGAATAVEQVVELESLSSKGMFAAPCLLQQLGREHASLPALSAPPLQDAAGSTAAAVGSGAGGDGLSAGERASLAACLATPLMAEEEVDEALRGELRAMAALREAHLQCRFAREVRGRGGDVRDEDSDADEGAEADVQRRKRKALAPAPALLPEPGLIAGGGAAAAAGKAVRPSLPGDVAGGASILVSPRSAALLAASSAGDASKHSLHLEARGSGLAPPCGTPVQMVAPPDDALFPGAPECEPPHAPAGPACGVLGAAAGGVACSAAGAAAAAAGPAGEAAPGGAAQANAPAAA